MVEHVVNDVILFYPSLKSDIKIQYEIQRRYYYMYVTRLKSKNVFVSILDWVAYHYSVLSKLSRQIVHFIRLIFN